MLHPQLLWVIAEFFFLSLPEMLMSRNRVTFELEDAPWMILCMGIVADSVVFSKQGFAKLSIIVFHMRFCNIKRNMQKKKRKWRETIGPRAKGISKINKATGYIFHDLGSRTCNSDRPLSLDLRLNSKTSDQKALTTDRGLHGVASYNVAWTRSRGETPTRKKNNIFQKFFRASKKKKEKKERLKRGWLINDFKAHFDYWVTFFCFFIFSFLITRRWSCKPSWIHIVW